MNVAQGMGAARQIPRPAGENAGLRDDAFTGKLVEAGGWKKHGHGRVIFSGRIN